MGQAAGAVTVMVEYTVRAGDHSGGLMGIRAGVGVEIGVGCAVGGGQMT